MIKTHKCFFCEKRIYEVFKEPVKINMECLDGPSEVIICGTCEKFVTQLSIHQELMDRKLEDKE